MAQLQAWGLRDKHSNAPNQIFAPGIEQYQRMVDAPGFVMTTDGNISRLDRFHGTNVKRLDYWAWSRKPYCRFHFFARTVTWNYLISGKLL